MAYQVTIANTDIYKCSFFPKTIGDWNALPDSLISSAEGAKDGVVKFASLVRARINLPGPGPGGVRRFTEITTEITIGFNKVWFNCVYFTTGYYYKLYFNICSHDFVIKTKKCTV